MPESSNEVMEFAGKILKMVQDGTLEPKKLSEDQRRVCVRWMYHDTHSYTAAEIGGILQVSSQTIYRDIKIINDDPIYSKLIIDEIQVVNKLVRVAEFASGRLLRLSKYKEAWSVLKECSEMLQSLGYMKKAAVEIDIGENFLSFLNSYKMKKEIAQSESDSNELPELSKEPNPVKKIIEGELIDLSDGRHAEDKDNDGRESVPMEPDSGKIHPEE